MTLHAQRLRHLVPEARVLHLPQELIHLVLTHLCCLNLMLQRILLARHKRVLDRVPLQVGLQLSEQLPLLLFVLSCVLQMDQLDG